MNDSVRFIHTADLHLDSPLASLAARNADLKRILQDASRTVLRRLVDCAIAECVDAVLIAGDLFDGEHRDVHTAIVLLNELKRLNKSNIPVFIIWGNHDAQAQLPDVVLNDLPDNVHVFDGRGGKRNRILIANDKAVIHGVSYSRRQAPDSLLGRFAKPEPNCINIGMLHTSLSGSEGHDDYAPCTVDELIAMDYDYWALGHIHKRKVHHADPAIVMPGNPQGRHINESGNRSITLVEIAQGKPAKLKEIYLAPVQFERIEVDLTAYSSRAEAIDIAAQTALGCQMNAMADQLVVRLHLNAINPLHAELQFDKATILEQIREAIEYQQDVWIDSLSVKNQNPNSKKVAAIDPDEFKVLPALESVINEQLLNSSDLRAMALEDMRSLQRALPAELRLMFGDPDEQISQTDTIISEANVWLQAQLNHADTKLNLESDSDQST